MLVSVNVIVFKCSALFRVFCDLILEDWRCDQYRWFQNGDKKLPTSQPIIRKKYFIADIQGLQSPLLGQRFCFTKFNVVKGYAGCSYIQVMHTGQDHWVTVEIIGEDEVRVFDSIFLKPTYYVVKQVASVMESRSLKVKMLLEKVQFQKNAVDCGVYAIAYMTDLCHGVDPSSCCYADSTVLRRHLIQCYAEGRMTTFPSQSSQKRRPSVYQLNIYCSCRLPFTLEHVKPKDVPTGEDTDMIQCEICCGWYHRTCVNLTHEKFKELQQPNVMWMCDYHGCAEAFDVFDSD